MIRWRFVLTRILIVVAVVLLLRHGLGPVASYVTVKGLQSATGAKVEIGSTEVGLFPPSIRYQHFRVADPRDDKAMRDALRADSIVLELDGEAMLHRRWVAREGSIKGLQIGASRETSGHFEYEEETEPLSASDHPGMISQLLGGVSDRLEDQATQATEDLETVRRSRAIKARWEQEYAALAARAKALEEKIRQSKSTAKQIENPLRDWDKIGNTVSMADEARAELKSILVTLESIPVRFQADMASMEQAKQIDLDRIDQYVPGNLRDTKNFGVDLVTGAVREQIATFKEYWEGGRKLANYTVVAPDSERGRGVDIDLLGRNRQPEILIRKCEVEGLMRADGNAYTMTGTIENMTPSPTLLKEPLRATLRLEGPHLVNVDYVRDRRAGNDIDRLTLHWPQSKVKQLKLGNDQHAMVTASGGQREIWVQMRSQNGRIRGQFISKQTGVNLDLAVDSMYDSLPATDALRQSLAAVDTVTINAGFSGDWDNLTTSVDTNLGDILQEAANKAITTQLAATKADMNRRVSEAFVAEQNKLNEWFTAKQTDARSLTAKADSLLEEMGRKLLDGVDSSEATIGRMHDFLKGRLR